MYFDEQDVVGESCETQFDVDMMATAVATSFPFAIVPRPSFLAPLPITGSLSFSSDTTAATSLEADANGDGEDEQDVCTHTRKPQRRRGEADADVEDSPTLTLMEPKSLAALSIVVPSSQQQDAESGSLNANAMQRLHLQTPRKDDESNDESESFVSETPGTIKKNRHRTTGNKRPRSGSSSPASSTSSSSTCASAVVLARKRALKESWRARHVTMVPKQENAALVFDKEEEEEEHAPRITSFVEYVSGSYVGIVSGPSWMLVHF